MLQQNRHNSFAIKYKQLGLVRTITRAKGLKMSRLFMVSRNSASEFLWRLMLVIAITLPSSAQLRLILPALQNQTTLQIVAQDVDDASSIGDTINSYVQHTTTTNLEIILFVIQRNVSSILSRDWTLGEDIVLFYFYHTFANLMTALDSSVATAPFNHQLFWYIFVSELDWEEYSYQSTRYSFWKYLPAFRGITVVYNEMNSSTKLHWTLHCAICAHNNNDTLAKILRAQNVPSVPELLKLDANTKKSALGGPTSLTQFSLKIGLQSTQFYRSREAAALIEPRNFSHEQVHILLGILSTYMNFTIEPKETSSTTPLFPTLVGCIFCNTYKLTSKALLSSSVYLIPIYIAHLNLIYCQPKDEYEARNPLEFIMSPFSPIVWACICCFCLGFGLFIGRSLGSTFEPIWAFLGQPPSKRSRRSLLVSFTIICFVILQTYYLSHFTANIIRPYPPREVETNYALLSSGYKLLDYYNEATVPKYQHHFNRFGLTMGESYFVEPCNATPPADCLKTMEYVTIPIHKKYTRYALDVSTKGSGKLCHAVQEIWSSQWMTFYFYSILAGRANEVLNKLRMGGIDIFWTSYYDASVQRAVGKSEARSAMTKQENGSERISLKSKFSDVFYLSSVMYLVSICVFLTELLFHNFLNGYFIQYFNSPNC